MENGGARRGVVVFEVFLAAEAVLLLVSLVVLVPVVLSDPGVAAGGPMTGRTLVILLVVPPVAAAVTGVGGMALFGGGPREGRARRELAVRWTAKDLGVGAAYGLGGLVLTVPASYLWARAVGPDDATSTVGEVFAGRQLGTATAVAVFLVVWLVAPVCEEVVFRGALWRALEHWGWPRWAVVAGTSVAFSCAHLELLRTPLLLVLSLPIALARLATDNLLASVVAHQVNNFLPAVALLMSVRS
ncbi:type II CAAX endopeptidase family protein [Actinosynnema sp. NPDC020468]|uniref:type II CAAX endopeptidase family protein n=1 Tax=Actinosynnema sp. NPDC020468 TaxID=3154488 RepID=UPI0033E8EA79